MKNRKNGLIEIWLVVQLIVIAAIMMVILQNSVYGFFVMCGRTQAVRNNCEYSEFGIYYGMHLINTRGFTDGTGQPTDTGSSTIIPIASENYLVTSNVVKDGNVYTIVSTASLPGTDLATVTATCSYGTITSWRRN